MMIRNKLLLITTFLFFLLVVNVASERPEIWPTFLDDLQDLACDQYQDDKCTRTSEITTGFKYINPGGSLTFNGVSARVAQSSDCIIYIKTSVVFLQHSYMRGCDIIIEASDIVNLVRSSISVTGTKVRGKGYSPDSFLGHSYGGSGGYCRDWPVPDISYGDFSTPYYNDDIATGSGGSFESLGGGRVVIITKTLYAGESRIEADGLPQNCDSARRINGGTGGYIYISTKMSFGPDSNILSANGGAGCGEDGLGGSGGRIILSVDPGESIKFNVSNRGGAANPLKPCSFGAAGTTLCQNCTGTSFESNLIVNGENKENVAVPTPTFINLSASPNITLIATNRASVIAKPLKENYNTGIAQLKNLQLYNGTVLTFLKNPKNNSDCNFNLTIGKSGILYKSEIRANCNITMEVGIVLSLTQGFISSGAPNTTINIKSEKTTIEESSGIVFTSINPTELLRLQTPQALLFQKSLADSNFTLDLSKRANMAKDSIAFTSIIIQGHSCIMKSGMLKATAVFISSNIFNSAGSIITTGISCNSTTFPDRSSMLNPIMYNLDIGKMTQAIMPEGQSDLNLLYKKLFFDYSIIVISQIKLTVNGTLQGSRIGLFTKEFNLRSFGVVSSAGLGCPSNMGSGFGLSGLTVGGNCASLGGAHANNGGLGLDMMSVINTPQCLAKIKSPQRLYDDPKNPVYEGSGGGSYSGSMGGAGGGVIILGSLGALFIDGVVNASGSSPLPTGLEDLDANMDKAGAGAGGSIQLLMQRANGNGSIIANGGNIGKNCYGGVGSGGRVRIQQLHWVDAAKLEHNSALKNISFSQGKRYGENGPQFSPLDQNSNGSLHGSSCPPGYYGPFCQPCTEDSFKDDFSSGQCKKCSIPERGVLSHYGAKDNYMCNFTCKYEIMNQGSIICASNIFFYALYREQDYLGTIVFLYIMFILATSWKTLKCKRSKKKSKEELPYLSVSLDQAQDYSLYFNSSHVQRIHILGDNTPESKWFINSDTVNLREIEDIREKMDYLMKIINRATNWKKLWIFCLKVFVLIYPPFYFFLLKRFRKKIAKKIDNFVKEINQDLAEYCVLRGLSVYYIVVKINDQASFGYLDLFHDDGGHSIRNTLLPVSYMFSGNGNYSSPYFINKEDPLIEHLIKIWTPRNTGLSEKGRVYFYHDFEKFVRKINKKIKYVDYYAPAPVFRHHLIETIKEVNKFKERFANEYSIFLNLTTFEVPRFTVEEADLTQHFLQSPVRVTVLEEFESDNFKELASRLQKVKNEDEYDIKIYLIVQTGRDLQDLALKTDQDKNSDFNRKSKKKKKSNNKDYRNTDVNELKSSFFNKLDQISFNVEYSLPRYMDVSPSGRKKNNNQVAERIEYTTSRKYFTIMQKLLYALVGYRTVKKRVPELYLMVMVLIIFQVIYLWMRTVALFELGQSSTLFHFLIPFPFAPFLTPLFGLLGIIKRESRLTLYFGIFNACCLANEILSITILIALNNTLWSVSWKEPLNLILYLVCQERTKKLLAAQSKQFD